MSNLTSDSQSVSVFANSPQSQTSLTHVSIYLQSLMAPIKQPTLQMVGFKVHRMFWGQCDLRERVKSLTVGWADVLGCKRRWL